MKDCDGAPRFECHFENCNCGEFDPDESGKICLECSHRAVKHAMKQSIHSILFIYLSV